MSDKPLMWLGSAPRDMAHRVFYVATFEEAVYVLDAFEKRTRKTLPHDVKLARERYRALLKKRAEDAKKK